MMMMMMMIMMVVVTATTTVAETIPEMLISFDHLSRLMDPEHFIEFSHRKSFKSAQQLSVC
jgi:hypothetical protein